MNIKELNIEQIITNSTLEEMFQVNFGSQKWIWVNKDIFLDILYNVIEYDFMDEEVLEKRVKEINEEWFFKILNDKFKEIDWISVDQKLFETLDDNFISTNDIKTCIYINRRYFTKKMIEKTNELNWILKAMAVDSYQYLALEDKTLIQIYEEYFDGNGMIIEEILTTGQYRFIEVTWKLDKESNMLEFYKIEERYSQWGEGNSSFKFNEFSK